MSKEDNSEPIDPNPSVKQQETESTKDDNEEEYLEDIRIELKDMYDSRVNFMNSVNQIKNRRINLALILTQFFCRYSTTQIIVFLSAATVLVILQGVQTFLGAFPHSTLYMGVLMTFLTLAFIVVTLKNILSALEDIKRIKQDYCSLGFLIAKKNDSNDESSDKTSYTPMIAYKDCFDMIRTLKMSDKQYKKYYLVPVLMLFLDRKKPNKVTIFEDMPLNISYEYKKQTFTQSWKFALVTLIPAAMIVLYSISVYMSYIAYTTLHQ